MFFRSEAHKKAINIITYGGYKRNFDFDDYVNRHIVLHNQRAALALRAEEIGLLVHPWSEFEKVGYLLQGIYPGILEAIKNAILADGQGLQKNFADAVRQCKDYMETTGNADGSNGNNCNISAINGDHGGRGGGGRYPGRGSHGGRGGGGLGGAGGRRLKEKWDQDLVEKCNDITLKTYPGHLYNQFDVNKSQRVFKNKHGRPRNAGPSPPATSVTLSEFSISMSTFGETLAAHTRRLTEDDRNCQRKGHGDNHNDTANKTNPNRSLNRAGGAPGRNERANGDRG